MKLLSKCKLLTLCFFLIALTVLVNIFNLVAVYRLVQSPSDSLSSTYAHISILDEESANTFYERIQSYNKDVLLEKEIGYRAEAVYFNNSAFTPAIISGRNFTEDDFYSAEKIVLIDESLKKECFTINNLDYLLYQNELYKVIGIYKANDNTVNQDALYYFPINVALNNNMIEKNGIYRLDIGKSIDDSLLSDINITLIKDNSKTSISEYIQRTIDEQSASVIALIIIIFMVMTNMFGVLKQWIHSKKPLIRAMYLVGAGHNNIFIKLITQYYTIVIFSFILAIPFAIIMTYFKWSIFSCFEVSIVSVVISIFIFVCISMPWMIYIFIDVIKISLHNGRVRL